MYLPQPRRGDPGTKKGLLALPWFRFVLLPYRISPHEEKNGMRLIFFGMFLIVPLEF